MDQKLNQFRRKLRRDLGFWYSWRWNGRPICEESSLIYWGVQTQLLDMLKILVNPIMTATFALWSLARDGTCGPS
jgi:hypothetical protein